MKRTNDYLNDDPMSIDTPMSPEWEWEDNNPRVRRRIETSEPESEHEDSDVSSLDLSGVKDRYSTKELDKMQDLYISTEESEFKQVDEKFAEYGVEEDVHEMYTNVVLRKTKSDLTCNLSDRLTPEKSKETTKLEDKLVREQEIDTHLIDEQKSNIQEVIRDKTNTLLEKAEDNLEKMNVQVDCDNALDLVSFVAELADKL